MLIVPIPWWLWLTIAPLLLTLRLTLITMVLLARTVTWAARAIHRRWQLRHA